MKKIFRTLLYLTTAVFVFSSCSDWLDLTPTDKLTDKVIWEDESSVDLYLNGFYTYLNQYGQFGSAQASGNLSESFTNTFKYGSLLTWSQGRTRQQLCIRSESDHHRFRWILQCLE